jgi:SPP1 gp7 family putative phage head morphogenesis protein
LTDPATVPGHACFAEADDETALAGADGKRVSQLLASAKDDGTQVFADACEKAVRRLLAAPDPLAQGVLFEDEELAEIADALSRSIATADLMGRVRIRRRAELVARAQPFSESRNPGIPEDPFHDFAEPVPALAPESALAYFRRLVPSLGAAATRYGPRLDRHAFTLAVASDQVILDRVKAAIVRALEGEGEGTPDVQEILDSAGVSQKNPQYAEMVVRTNLLDAYNQGAEAELAEPEMKEAFPAWEYLGVLDSRTGDDHKPKIGKYYPATASFAEVRGPRVFNCRCSFAPVSRYLMNGVRVEERW